VGGGNGKRAKGGWEQGVTRRAATVGTGTVVVGGTGRNVIYGTRENGMQKEGGGKEEVNVCGGGMANEQWGGGSRGWCGGRRRSAPGLWGGRNGAG